jgi:hypothetical protein
LDAFLEFDVFVPEGVALEVEADEVSTSLEETMRSVEMFGTSEDGEGEGQKDIQLAGRKTTRKGELRQSNSMWVISARKCQSARYRVHGARKGFPAGHCQTRKCAVMPLSARRSLWCDLGFCKGEKR